MKALNIFAYIAIGGILLGTCQIARSQEQKETPEQIVARNRAKGIDAHVMTPEEKVRFEEIKAYFEQRDSLIQDLGGGEVYEILRDQLYDLQADYYDNPTPKTRGTLLGFVKENRMFVDIATLPSREAIDSLKRIGLAVKPRRMLITDLDSLTTHFDAIAGNEYGPLSPITRKTTPKPNAEFTKAWTEAMELAGGEARYEELKPKLDQLQIEFYKRPSATTKKALMAYLTTNKLPWIRPMPMTPEGLRIMRTKELTGQEYQMPVTDATIIWTELDYWIHKKK